MLPGVPDAVFYDFYGCELRILFGAQVVPAGCTIRVNPNGPVSGLLHGVTHGVCGFAV